MKFKITKKGEVVVNGVAVSALLFYKNICYEINKEIKVERDDNDVDFLYAEYWGDRFFIWEFKWTCFLVPSNKQSFFVDGVIETKSCIVEWFDWFCEREYVV